MNNRINFQHQGRMVMNYAPDQYLQPIPIKPKFIMDYSTKKPSKKEASEASQSLLLLKQKMGSNVKGKSLRVRYSHTNNRKSEQGMIYRKKFDPVDYISTQKQKIQSEIQEKRVLDSLNQLNQNFNSIKKQPLVSEYYQGDNSYKLPTIQSKMRQQNSIRSGQYENRQNYPNKIKSSFQNTGYQKNSNYDSIQDTKYQQKNRYDPFQEKLLKMNEENQKNTMNQKDNYYEQNKNNFEKDYYQQKYQKNIPKQNTIQTRSQQNQQRIQQQKYHQKQDNNQGYQNSYNNQQKLAQTKSVNKNTQQRQQNKQQNYQQDYQQDYQQEEIQQQKQEKQDNDLILQQAEEYKRMKKYTCSQGCGRQFIKQALQKHEKLCVKVFQKQKKVFNSFQQRAQIDGVQLKKVTKKQLIKEKKTKKGAKKWEAESLKFRQMLRNARGQQPMKLDKKEQKIIEQFQEEDTLKCPVCSRTFNKNAGERHIKFCKEKALKNQYKKPNKKPDTKKRRYQQIEKNLQFTTIFFF